MIETLLTIGSVHTVVTMVDFYTYIKTVEYMICVLFFCVFPMFYKRIMKEKPPSQK